MIGRFDERVTFQYQQRVADGAGGTTVTWVTDFTDWAMIRPMSAEENIAVGQQVDIPLFRVTFRYTNDFTQPFNTQYRLLWDGEPMNIKHIRNKNMLYKWYELICAKKRG